jgi:hypothetical protein
VADISSVRLAIPGTARGEIPRKELVASILGSQRSFTYIHAGAGYGKTTLLSQVAHSVENAVWATLDGENDVFAFVSLLSEAIRRTFPDFDFSVSRYMPFEHNGNFTTILSNALISSIEKYTKDFTIILDDLHTIEGQQVKKLLACIIKYKPGNIRLCLSSREIPWQELVPFRVRGSILELAQKDLAFTQDETVQILGFDDEYICRLTEGWPLAVGSFKVLLESGVSVVDIPSQGNEALYSYLFYECVSRLPLEMIDFLKTSACFEELEPRMLDELLGRRNARLVLESLVARNIFILKISGGYYRYHTLFRNYLLEGVEDARIISLQSSAASYYLDKKQFSRAARYAMRSDNKQMLEQILLASYRDYIKSGSFSELRLWFHALGDEVSGRELLVAKGTFLSSIGNFTEAKLCLDTAIPQLSGEEGELYFEAMVHKARVLRNHISFEESNRLLDALIPQLKPLDSELSYTVLIEKIYNLCWSSQINEACALIHDMIECCGKAGNSKTKAWYERYLSVVHFLAGRMKEAVYYHEKSLGLPEAERQYLDIHSTGIYIAKAYQMLGERDKAVSMVSAELQKLESLGRYEELWLGYLYAAEIHYQNTFIDRMNGGGQTFQATTKYFTLAEEYAPLYRKTDFQMQWAKMQRNIYSLIFTSGPKETAINEIYSNLDHVYDYFKTIALARLFSYFGTVSDFSSAVRCAKLSIEIGERANMMLIPTMAYGILARAAVAMKDQAGAAALTKRFLQLCHENGVYEYFRMRTAYDPVLEFSLDNGIEPGITKQMMAFAGYKIKKLYITTLGGFSVLPYGNRREPVKMRTKKERELLALLLDAGKEGITKEQIYEALWQDSTSDNFKKLIGVNLAQIKKDLAVAGILNPIINCERHYSICRDEIVADSDLFEAAAEEFKRQRGSETAQKLLSLYKGEYLSDFEAHWAVGKRLRYHKIYTEALEYGRNL